MPPEIYVDQSAGDLRFCLATGAVDMGQFHVLCEQSLQIRNHQVRFGIIGASHFFTLTKPDGKILNEIFACREVKTEAPCIKSGPLSEIEPIIACDVHKLGYSFIPSLMTWDKAKKKLNILLNQIALSKKNEVGLKFEFPRKEGQKESALTLLWAQKHKHGHGFCLETAHCYPNEGNIVFTQTNVEGL